jgi:hypothetical protein
LDVPASTVTTALASDGVDVVRWRPRVALSLPRGGHGGGGEDADAGWRRLRDDDVISFAHSTGEGETASHTTPFAWCTPFLKDFSRRHSSPALPFQRLTGKTFD